LFRNTRFPASISLAKFREQQAQADTIGEQQLKRMQLGRSSWGAAAKADAVGAQQLKQTQLGRSSV